MDCKRIITAPHMAQPEPEPDTDPKPEPEMDPEPAEPPLLLTDSEDDHELEPEPEKHPESDHELEPEPDKFSEIDKFIHDIEESDDDETIEAKHAFNDALISNTELEMLHREAIEQGLGSTVEDIWTLRRDPDMSEIEDLDFKESMDEISTNFANNSLVENQTTQLPVVTHTASNPDIAMEALTSDLAALEISMPKPASRTWLEQQWNQVKTEDEIINIESSEDQDLTPITDAEVTPIPVGDACTTSSSIRMESQPMHSSTISSTASSTTPPITLSPLTTSAPTDTEPDSDPEPIQRVPTPPPSNVKHATGCRCPYCIVRARNLTARKTRLTYEVLSAVST